MPFKYSLIDDNSDLTIGYFNTFQCSKSLNHSRSDHTYQLVLHLFTFTEDFKQRIMKRKESFPRLIYIGILNNSNHVIGKYLLFIHDEIQYHKSGFLNSPADLNLHMSSDHMPSSYQLQLWERWRQSAPTTKNEWAHYDEDRRRDWLKIVSLYHGSHTMIPTQDAVPNVFEMDGTFITDYASFFCAIGEAICGAGGYFGKNIYSLIDCTYGGYGAFSPFTLVWYNSEIAKNSLDQQAWNNEIEAIRQENIDIPEEDFFEELSDRPLMDALIENLEKVGVTVILK